MNSIETEKITNSIFFNLICRDGTPEIVSSYLKLYDVDEYTIRTGFDNGCMFNLDNAKLLYTNYQSACEKYVNSMCFFAKDLVNHNKLDTLLWLKSIDLKPFIFQIDILFAVLINQKQIECDGFKLLYEHFNDRFQYLKNTAINNS